MSLLAAVAALASAAPAAARHSTIANLSTAPPPLPWPQGTGSTPVEFNAASQDGTHVFFTTEEPIVPDDRDRAPDIFERHAGVTRLVSTGDRATPLPPAPSSGMALLEWTAVSEDGLHAFFETNVSLTTTDFDGQWDVYEWTGGATRLVSTGNGPHAAGAQRQSVSADGLRVVFGTTERLAPEDVDGAADVYERANGTTTLLTPGTAEKPAWFVAMSRDADHVFIETEEPLAPEDGDTLSDIYELHAGAARLVTSDPRYTRAEPPHIFTVSRNGERAVFESSEPLAPQDTDSATDVYDYADGVTRLLTEHVSGVAQTNNLENSSGVSPDGERVYFESWERLVSEDTDDTMDVYAHDGERNVLLTRHPRFGAIDDRFERASDDGAHVFVTTGASMVPFPEDRFDVDVYDVGGATPVLISAGGDGGAFFHATSADGSKVVFGGWDPMTPEDTDTSWDLYEYEGGPPTLLTRPGVRGGGNAFFRHATPDLSRITFETPEAMLASDADGTVDVYQAGIASTAGYARPQGSSPIRVSLVPAFEQCTDPNTRHRAPLAFDACNPPRPLSAHLTVGTPPANSHPARSVAHARLSVVAGDPATAPDEADIGLALSITDVRSTESLADYTGEVKASATLRLTDSMNGPSGSDPATVMDFPLEFTAACAETAAEDVGATCSVTTSADSLVPGFMQEGNRSVVKVSALDVSDGGEDGVAATTPNSVFAWQGLFVP